VIAVVEPIWGTKTETATRVRSRIELVLDFAGARGLREGPNPARWRGNLDAALPKASKVASVRHHAAVAVGEVGVFVRRLQKQEGVGARALEFAILTAARSGEVRGATWSEVDLGAAVWTVPATRMKSGREHRVPLSRQALKMLRSMPGDRAPDVLLFPSLNGPLSDMSLTAVLRRMKVEATAHGFRSTFRDWVAEHTDYPREVAEMALAHAVGDKVEAAYRRGDLFEKRISLMSDWATFLASAPHHAGTP
jgi:integrase